MTPETLSRGSYKDEKAEAGIFPSTALETCTGRETTSPSKAEIDRV